MSSEVSEALTAIGEQFGLVIDWSQQNVQPYIENLIQRVAQYKIATNICGLVILALIITASTIMIIRFCKMKSSGRITVDNDEFEIGLMVVSAVCLIMGIIISIFVIQDIFKCYYVPEIVFIEEVKSSIK